MAGTAVVVNEFGAVGHRRCDLRPVDRCGECAASRQRLPLLHGRRRPRRNGLVARPPRRPSAADRHRDDRACRSRAGAPPADGRSAAGAVDAARHRGRDDRCRERRSTTSTAEPIAARQCAVADRRVITKGDIAEADGGRGACGAAPRAQPRRRDPARSIMDRSMRKRSSAPPSTMRRPARPMSIAG